MVPKFLALLCVRHTDAFHAQTAREEARSQREINEFFLSWAPKVRQLVGSHAVGLGEWDWLGLFAVGDLADWEAMWEQHRREYSGRVSGSMAVPTVQANGAGQATQGRSGVADARRRAAEITKRSIARKYLVFELVRYSDEHYLQASAPRERAAATFYQRWQRRVELVCRGRALGLAAPWEELRLYAMSELSDWEAMGEERARRLAGRYARIVCLPGVSHPEFTRATGHIEHYRRLRRMGVFPGGAEIHRDTA